MYSISARAARHLRCGASTMVVGIALAQAVPAFAQAQPSGDTAATPLSERTSTNNPNPANAPEKSAIVVTGQRRALSTSQQIKRNADTVVDSITATDIGSFPDKSVAEALQRVPGITVNRFAATTDTGHYSAEPSGVLIRGLTQVRSEFNGRDTFSANSSRGLNWSDITPELLAGVDVYKNQTAEMIEGGIAGTVDLRTRVPFDAPGQLVQVAVRANYGDLAHKWTPDINGFYSNRWQTGAGEFGIMGNVAYSGLKTLSQGIQYGRTGVIINGAPGWPAETFFPYSVNFINNEYDRKRYGIAGAAQWKSNDGKLLVTGQYLRSLYKNNWRERDFGSFGIGPDLYGTAPQTRIVGPLGGSGNLNGLIPVPAPGSPPFTFDSNGNFQSGVINHDGHQYWWGNPPGWNANSPPLPGINVGHGVNSLGQPMFDTCYPTAWSTPAIGCVYGSPTGWGDYGDDVGTTSRINQNRSMTQDADLNVKWNPTPNLHFNFDGQYVNSKVDNYDVSIEFHSYANVGLNATGPLPRVTLAPPSSINQSPGGLSNPDNYFIRSVSDHLEDSRGHEAALRADGDYDFHTDWLDSLKFGARYSDREQLVQWSTYNWQNIANTWTDCQNTNPYFNLDSAPGGTCQSTGEVFKGYPAGSYQMQPFGASFFGGYLGTFPFVPFDFLESRKANLFSQQLIGVGSYIPICERNGQLPGTPVEMANSCFTQDEVNNVSERTKSAYLMLKFGGPNAYIGTLRVSGNVGVRYVETTDLSKGFIQYPNVPGVNTALCPRVPIAPGYLTGNAPIPGDPTFVTPPAGGAYYPSFCYLSAADRSFASGGGSPQSARNSYPLFLPSFNVRVDLTPKWLLRFAASKAVSRPDIGFLKNYLGVSMSLPNGSNLTDPRWVLGANGQPTGVAPTYTGQAFNPYLKPSEAWQFDLSLEHYFATVGQFSLAGFYKNFTNYIQYGTFNETVTNAGITRPVRVTGPANGKGAKIEGFEVDYQRFFDFLPGALKGLGMQANFTYVKNKGIPNANLTPVGSTGNSTNAGSAGASLQTGALEGLSKYTYNLVGMYEKGKVSARLAYNWRSKFLVTSVDCCVYLPVWQKSAGFLDASLRYTVNNSLELSLEASNLLNTRTVLMQQVSDQFSPEHKIILTPNGWFQTDRRFIVGIRWKMAGNAAPPPPAPRLLPPAPAPTQTCADGTVVEVTATCPAPPPPPPPPPPAEKSERGQ